MAKNQRSSTVKNLFKVDGYKATIDYDPEIEVFRGEFIGKRPDAPDAL